MNSKSILSFVIGVLFIVVFSQNPLFAQNKTEVLILGTTHLSQIKGFEKKSLQPVLSRLEDFEFDAICIEGMPTELLNDIVSREDDTYKDLIKYYGEARLSYQNEYKEKLQISFVDAHKKIDSLVNLESIQYQNRIKLIDYYLATGDIASAVLQYKYVKDDTESIEQHFDKKIIETLQTSANYNNETYSLAVELAKRENLQKLEYIDNLQDEPLLYADFSEFITEYVKNKDQFEYISSLPIFKKIDSIQSSSIDNNDLLPLYKFLNSEEYQKADYEAQWKLWLNTNFESKTDLSRYALWEMRNMQIAANIMKVSAYYPGQKILVIIGSSHKSFLEKYLNQCPTIDLLQFD